MHFWTALRSTGRLDDADAVSNNKKKKEKDPKKYETELTSSMCGEKI